MIYSICKTKYRTNILTFKIFYFKMALSLGKIAKEIHGILFILYLVLDMFLDYTYEGSL